MVLQNHAWVAKTVLLKLEARDLNACKVNISINNYEFKLADDEEGGSAKATVDVKVGLNFTANLGFGMNMKQKDYW
eukprot:CAMPEP_0117021658 /NCGR_PEP_ID=MMETSP0472-20121206/16320_1 /TAXON_ID=693140 ORGANISM="Tiarina fusus, Strain LIS" /NCGR_SAMPLE_ID=MMETSP0472 /ASSEMBLY_ACC=CAM_ASM_000603 /LENGTH=75 /DNA_ID=CAMNT_0004727211 /DNA_START=968 /DNA_END=1192 /DNA_ORIENTATION=-